MMTVSSLFQIVVLAFAMGAFFGLVVSVVLGVALSKAEWDARRKLERRVDRIYQALACGQGYFNCKGGPNCQSDHK